MQRRNPTILFLGSSVTYGGGNYSFVEMLAEDYGVKAIKEAVSGTTLTDDAASSYVSRLLTIPESPAPDAFLCQLSTNDAGQCKPLGEISPSFDPNDFDLHTITGALEFIIAHVRRVWGCPVLFYTGTRFDSPAYAAMVQRLQELAAKWPIRILDLWNDPAMLAVRPEDYSRWMNDPVHPNREGYREWWLPKFAAFLQQEGIL